ncbi:hypothetical protein P171DRAFT_515442 [Karstenula rhodostoma CBS 690.94]|uniref:Uncharacterized protein n=1 Tax=Karstenula rhodostoma CBS 690.94 TaxID=1392251 RepID=A0A9P4PYY2_9PLEO|nr:hypothetical protein P171DRAFT_515442 [Karstenula rhodostoma CBS 690.94]
MSKTPSKLCLAGYGISVQARPPTPTTLLRYLLSGADSRTADMEHENASFLAQHGVVFGNYRLAPYNIKPRAKDLTLLKCIDQCVGVYHCFLCQTKLFFLNGLPCVGRQKPRVLDPETDEPLQSGLGMRGSRSRGRQ